MVGINAPIDTIFTQPDLPARHTTLEWIFDMPGVILWPLALYFALVLVVVGGMLGISYLLGQRHHDRATGEPYESGIPATGSARIRFDVNFYLNAMFFVVFDLEAMFIFSWAIAFRQVGWAGFVEVLIFILVLVAALAYLWRLGALDWGSRRYRRRPDGRQTEEEKTHLPGQS
jgi:NADH-quinone oxidoreductase subunit A